MMVVRPCATDSHIPRRVAKLFRESEIARVTQDVSSQIFRRILRSMGALRIA